MRFKIKGKFVFLAMFILSTSLTAEELFPQWILLQANRRIEEISQIRSKIYDECRDKHNNQEIKKKYEKLKKKMNIPFFKSRKEKKLSEYKRKIHEINVKRAQCYDKPTPRLIEIYSEEEKGYSLAVYKAPNFDSKKIGELIIKTIRENESGFPRHEIYYVKNNASNPIPFPIDIPDGDYTQPLHTVLEREGDWLKIPRHPYKTAGWINWLETFKAQPILKSILGPIYKLSPITAFNRKNMKKEYIEADQGILFTDIRANSLTFRLEHPSDMSCGREVRTPKEEALEYFEINKSAIFDKNDHLKIRKKYWKGC